MTRLVWVLGAWLLLALSPSAMGWEESGAARVAIQIQVFRVLGDFSGDLSLTDDIWSGIEKPADEAKRNFTFFTRGAVSVAGTPLKADEKEWLWGEGKKIPLGEDPDGSAFPGDRIAMVAHPSILTTLGSDTLIDVTSQQTIQYFERVEGDTFALRSVQQPTGIAFRMRVEKQNPDRILLRDFTVTSRIVEDRKPIKGLGLNVGEPIVTTREFKASMNLRPDFDYGILIHGKDMPGLLLVRLRVSPEGAAPSEAGSSSAESGS